MYNFRTRLMITLGIFALLISVTIATADYYHIRQQAKLSNQLQVERIEETILLSLETIDKVYYLFGEELAGKMKESTEYLLELYSKVQDFDEWDFAELKDRLGFDIYIINEQQVITHSSFQEDIGLNFAACCKRLSQILEERRQSGEFYHDGIDIEQKTGTIKKYSYMATPDKQYLIQLGYSLQDGAIYQQFNITTAIERLLAQYPSLNEIRVLNLGGLPFGRPIGEVDALSEERRQAFQHARDTGEVTELRGTWQQEPAVYRYVRYESKFDTGSTQTKVLEIIYNEYQLESVLYEKMRLFIMQLAAILLTTVVLSIIISRWMARPMYLAFHDSLTGLKNRAAFNEMMEKELRDGNAEIALLMLDLDYFKQVNDTYGHDAGDRLLKIVADLINKGVEGSGTAFRLGGDEFVIIMTQASREEVEQTAKRLIDNLKQAAGQLTEPVIEEEITASIGIAFVSRHGADLDVETICKQADKALYAAKDKGKNQYHIYREPTIT